MTRRTLDYPTFDALRTDLARFRAGPYSTVGNWSLGQICDHLDKFVAQSIDGFPFRLSWYMRLAGPLLLKGTLRKRRIPTGVKAPASFAPPATPTFTDLAALDRFEATVDRYLAHPGPLHPSPLFGRITREQWDQVHLIHAAHHLSFAVPSAAPAVPAA